MNDDFNNGIMWAFQNFASNLRNFHDSPTDHDEIDDMLKNIWDHMGHPGPCPQIKLQEEIKDE